MGNIYKTVEICGLTIDGDKKGCARGRALVDTGATMSMMSAAFAAKTKAVKMNLKPPTTIDGRPVKTALVAITLAAPGCGIRPSVVVVDDMLMRRAGTDDEGGTIDVILGHDYLQNEKAAIDYKRVPAQVRCATIQAKKPKARRKRKQLQRLLPSAEASASAVWALGTPSEHRVAALAKADRTVLVGLGVTEGPMMPLGVLGGEQCRNREHSVSELRHRSRLTCT